MKKKVQQKKQIIPVFSPLTLWQYKNYTPQQISQIDNFITNFQKELRALLIEPTLDANIKILFQKIGLNIHPSLMPKIKNHQLKHLNQDGYGQKYIIFLNHKIDIATLKLTTFILSCVKANSLKFSNNSFNQQQLKVLTHLINKQENVNTLFFQWNPLHNLTNGNNFYTQLIRPCFSNIILRSCKIGDIALKELVNKILGITDCKLKYLDLYDNNISNDGIQSLSKLIQQNRSLQCIGLSKNIINLPESLDIIFKCIGNLKLSEQQYLNYKRLQKQRDEIIQKNKKRKKGVAEQPVPFLLPIQQIDNEWYYIKNHKLKNVNLGWNGINQRCLNVIKHFIQRINKKEEVNFELVLIGNEFGNSSLDLLREINGIKI